MKKLFLFSLIVTAGLFLSGCTKVEDKNNDSSKDNNNQQSNENSKSDSDNDTEEYDYDECILGCEMLWNDDDGNKDKSEAEKDKSCKDLCKSGEGMAENNLEACAQSDGIMRDSCYSVVADNLVDGEICEKISDEIMKMGCYSTLAEKTGDPKYCEGIENEMYRGFCMEQE